MTNDDRADLERIIAEAQAKLESLPPSSGDVQTTGDGDIEAEIINTGVLVTHIVNHYHAGGGQLSEADYREALVRYLRWLSKASCSVVLPGIQRGGQQAIDLPLDEVYVPLAAKALPKARETLKASLQGEIGRAEPITVQALLQQGERLAVTGGPGCGKTTVLQHIAWTLAEALSTDQADLAEERLSLTGQLPLPILVPLSRYGRYRQQFASHEDPRKCQLATFINHYLIERQASVDLPEDFFSTLFKQGRDLILLLDGLDEVPSEDERALVSQAVKDLTYGRDHIRVVLTSRTQAYHGKAALGQDFRMIEVLTLESEQVAQLIHRAYEAIIPEDVRQDDRLRRATSLIDGVDKLEANRRQRLGGGEETRLVTSPLMVRMLLIVHFNMRRLPDQRAELYAKVIETLLTSDHNPDEVVAQTLARQGGDWRLRRDMLQHLAFQMHSQGQEAGREIDERTLTGWLTDYLTSRRRRAAQTAEDEIAAFIAHCRQRGGVLEEIGSRYRFSHLSFQEFLSARHLAEVERDAQQIVGQVQAESYVLSSWWREPLLLTAGYLYLDAPDTADDFIHLLAGLDQSAPEMKATTSIDLAAAEIAATAYLEWGEMADLQPALAERLAGLLSAQTEESLDPVLRDQAGQALSRLGDPRPGVGESDIAWCEVPAGPFLMGAASDEEGAYDDEKPQHELTLPAYYISRYLSYVNRSCS